jgi:hypothetical protein
VLSALIPCFFLFNSQSRLLGNAAETGAFIMHIDVQSRGFTLSVASHVDSDLYRAIARAFAKLERGTRAVLGTSKPRRRATQSWLDTPPATDR